VLSPYQREGLGWLEEAHRAEVMAVFSAPTVQVVLLPFGVMSLEEAGLAWEAEERESPVVGVQLEWLLWSGVVVCQELQRAVGVLVVVGVCAQSDLLKGA